MGMLSDTELVQALATNIEGWEFELHNDKFVIDQNTGAAFVREYKRLISENAELKKRIDANRFLGGLH